MSQELVCDKEYKDVYSKCFTSRREHRQGKPQIINLIAKTQEFLNENEEAEKRIKAARLERKDLYHIFMDFIERQSPIDLLAIVSTKILTTTPNVTKECYIEPNSGFRHFGDVIAEFFSTNGNDSALEDTAAAINHLLAARRELPEILQTKNVIKAAMLLYAYQNRVVYMRILDYVLGTHKCNAGYYIRAKDTLERKGLITPLKKDEIVYRFQRQKHELKKHTARERQWFALTRIGECVVREHLAELKAVLPPEVLERATVDAVYVLHPKEGIH